MHRNTFHLLGKPSRSLLRDGTTIAYGSMGQHPKFISLFSGAMGLDLGEWNSQLARAIESENLS